MPLGLMEYVDDDDAMRFKSALPAGARQDQMLADVAAGIIRGVSAEFLTLKTKPVELGDDPLMEIHEAKLLRASAVDDGAYPQSKIQMAMEPKKPMERPGDHRLRIEPVDEPARPRILMVA